MLLLQTIYFFNYFNYFIDFANNYSQTFNTHNYLQLDFDSFKGV